MIAASYWQERQLARLKVVGMHCIADCCLLLITSIDVTTASRTTLPAYVEPGSLSPVS